MSLEKILTSRWIRPALIGIALLAGVANLPFALRPGHLGNDIALGMCGGSVVAQIAIWIVSSRLYGRKEEEPSSQSQQPTPGTSPSPNPSSSHTHQITGSPFLSLSGLQSLNPSPSVNQSQPEKRAMPVVGFRSWRAYPHHKLGVGPSWKLGAWNQKYGVWTPGRNKAICHASYGFSLYGGTPKPHEHTPAQECACGFYVLTDFDKVPFATSEATQLTPNGPVVEKPVFLMVGAVVGWGRVIQHGDEGWRAENVQVIALLDCKVSDEHLRVTHEVAEAYGVPVLSRTALELLAKEYGDPLPVPALTEGRST